MAEDHSSSSSFSTYYGGEGRGGSGLAIFEANNNKLASLRDVLLVLPSSLQVIDLSRNEMTYPLPVLELDDFAIFPDLTKLDLSFNNISTSIRVKPTDSRFLLTVSELNFENNDFFGPISDLFSSFPLLRLLGLANNRFSRTDGPGPLIPNFLVADYSRVTTTDVPGGACPSFTDFSGVMIVTLDHSYHDYLLCTCRLGFFNTTDPGPESRCAACLSNADCVGYPDFLQNSTMTPKNGYYPIPKVVKRTSSYATTNPTTVANQVGGNATAPAGARAVSEEDLAVARMVEEVRRASHTRIPGTEVEATRQRTLSTSVLADDGTTVTYSIPAVMKGCAFGSMKATDTNNPCIVDSETGSFSCKEGHRDRLCANCASDYFQREGECIKCRDSKGLYPAVLILFSFLVFTLATVIACTRDVIPHIERVYTPMLSTFPLLAPGGKYGPPLSDGDGSGHASYGGDVDGYTYATLASYEEEEEEEEEWKDGWRSSTSQNGTTSSSSTLISSSSSTLYSSSSSSSSSSTSSSSTLSSTLSSSLSKSSTLETSAAGSTSAYSDAAASYALNAAAAVEPMSGEKEEKVLLGSAKSRTTETAKVRKFRRRALRLYLQSILAVSINFFQTLSIAIADLSVPASFVPVIAVSELTRSSSEGIGLECFSVFESFTARYNAMMIFPCVVIAIILLVFTLSFVQKYGRKRAKREEKLATRTDDADDYLMLGGRIPSGLTIPTPPDTAWKVYAGQVLYVVNTTLNFFFFPITTFVLSVYNCEEDPVSGIEYMVEQPYLECDAINGWAKAVPIVCYVLLPIVSLVGVMVWIELKGTSYWINTSFSMFFDGFKSRSRYFALVFLFRRLSLAAVVTFMSVTSIERHVLIILILLLSVALDFEVRPFFFHRTNVVDVAANCVLILVYTTSLLSDLLDVSDEDAVFAGSVFIGCSVFSVLVILWAVILPIYEVLVKGRDHDHVYKNKFLDRLDTAQTRWAEDGVHPFHTYHQ